MDSTIYSFAFGRIYFSLLEIFNLSIIEIFYAENSNSNSNQILFIRCKIC